MTDNIKLPPLPEARIVSYQIDSVMRREELHTHNDSDLLEYGRACYEKACADLIAEMQPVAWAAVDETETVVEALGMNQSRRFDTALCFIPKE